MSTLRAAAGAPALTAQASGASDFEEQDDEGGAEEQAPSSTVLLFSKLSEPREGDRSPLVPGDDAAATWSGVRKALPGGRTGKTRSGDELTRIAQKIDSLGASRLGGSSSGSGSDDAGVKKGRGDGAEGVWVWSGGDAADVRVSIPEVLSAEAVEENLRAAVLESERGSVANYGLITAPSAAHPPLEENPPEPVPRSCHAPHVAIDLSDSDEDPNADLSLEDDSGDVVVVEVGGNSRDQRKNKAASEGETTRLQELAYLMADSGCSFVFTLLLIAMDQVFFFLSLLYMLRGMSSVGFTTSHIAVDCITAVSFFFEVNLRLYSYGAKYFFHSILRRVDYSVCTLNAGMILASFIARQTRWLLVVRYIRLVRTLTVVVMWRERRIKTQAMLELEELAVLLENERSEQNRLVKWRIDSDAIAMGDAAGHGVFGAVFLGLFRGTLVAIKQLYQNNNQAAEYTSIEDEAVTLVNLRHPNVVLFMGFVHEIDKLWIVTEYCSRGSLRDLLDSTSLRLTQNRVLKFALGAARGLAYLHGQDSPVLHLDLKTSNILISSGWETKLADFGLSKNIDNIENNKFAGTIQYSAPEILESNTFSEAADVYSFGICLWEMAAREIPFEGTSPMEVLWGVVKENRRPPLDVIREKPREWLAQQRQPSSHGMPTDELQLHDFNDTAKTRTRIDAAVVVAAGSLKSAAKTKARLSLPQLSANLPSADFSGLKRKALTYSTGTTPSPAQRKGLQLGDVLSPVPTMHARAQNREGHLSPESVQEPSHDANSWTSSANSALDYWPIVPPQRSSQSNSVSKSERRSERVSQGSNALRPKRTGRMIRKMSKAFSNTSDKSSNSSAPSATSDRSNKSVELDLARKERRKRGSVLKMNGLGGSTAGSVAGDGDDDTGCHSSGSRVDLMADRIVGSPKTPAGPPKGLDVLSSKVSAKIQLFDDRPNVAKRGMVAPPSLTAAVLPAKVKDALQFKRSMNDDGMTEGGASPSGVPRVTLTNAWGDDPSARDRVIAQPTPKRCNTFQKRMQSFSTLPPKPSRGADDVLKGQDERMEMAARSEAARNMSQSPQSSGIRGGVEMSDEYVELITRCWAKSPADRPTADEIVWRLVSMIDGQIRASHDHPQESPT